MTKPLSAYLLAIVDGHGAIFTYAPATGKVSAKLCDGGSLYGRMLQWRDKGYTVSPLASPDIQAWICYPPDSDHEMITAAFEAHFARRAEMRIAPR